jgi:hypothetical protein
VSTPTPAGLPLCVVSTPLTGGLSPLSGSDGSPVRDVALNTPVQSSSRLRFAG